MTISKVQRSFWFDMDGVLVQHFAQDYIPTKEGNRLPKYLTPHYFENLPEVELMTEAVKELSFYCGTYTPETTHLSILSKVSMDADLYMHQVDFKVKWIANNEKLNSLNNLNAAFTGTSKVKKAKAILGRELTAHDILVDDWNENLLEWEAAGGTAIKFGKGNRKSWSGYSIQMLSEATEIVDFLLALAM